MSIREAFVEKFGEEHALALEAACERHRASGLVTLNNYGADPFKTVIAVCIGFQCFELDEYRQYHGVTAPYEEIKQWIVDNAELGAHDGDVDLLAAFSGSYDDYIKASTQS